MKTLTYVIQQLPYLVPVLLVFVVGVVLSFVHLKRCPKPAAFALAGCGMLFLIYGSFPFVQSFLFAYREERGLQFDQIEQWLMVVGITRTLLSAVGFSLLLAAIFVDRKARPE